MKSDSLAIDWIGRNLYWVDGAAGQILAVRLSSSIVAPQNYIVILDEDLEQPHSLVLLPQKGYVQYDLYKVLLLFPAFRYGCVLAG